MKHIWLYLLLTCCSLILSPSGIAKNRVEPVSNMANLLEAAQKINATGTLSIDHNHFVYLAVSDEFITKLYPILNQQLKPEEKPCLEPDNNEHGAHISMFYPNEIDEVQLNTLPINATYNFHVIGISKVDARHHSKHVVWFVIQVQAPELQALVNQISADKLIKVPFHISIARERFNAQGNCYIQHRSSTVE